MALDFVKISKYISSSRLHKYQTVSSSDRQTLKLYQTNLRLSQAFYPLLSLLEVILRNALNEELTRHFNDPDWLRNQRNGFMSHPSLNYIHRVTRQPKTNSFLRDEVSHSITTLRKSQNTVTHNKIIADLKFGFWIALFDYTHYTILNGVPIRIFYCLPTGANRQTVDTTLTRIRNFRNRVYHNEPILFSIDTNGNSHFDLTLAKDVYNDIQNIFKWLDLDYAAWSKRIDNIDFELKRANLVYLKYPSKKYYYFRLKLGLLHYKSKYYR